MNTEKTENLNESRFVKAYGMVYKTYLQIGVDRCKEENMRTNEQLIAYNVAIEVLDKMCHEMLQLLQDDYKDEVKKINFDEKGHLI